MEKEKEFIPHKQAIALEELGFFEVCFGVYDYCEELHIGKYYPREVKKPSYLAPLYQQAFRFFREEYNYNVTISPSKDYSGNTTEYYYEITFQGWEDGIKSDSYGTYEEAELECLKKINKVVKNK